jgi:ammonium transporter Rh
MKLERNQIIWIVVVLIAAAIAGGLIYFDWQLSGPKMGDFLVTEPINADLEMIKYSKNLDIWFMLFMVAFLMMFIKKFEWGVALGVVLSTAGSFLGYLFMYQFVMPELTGEAFFWGQDVMLGAVICAITIVIGIGVFLGLCKMWQYLLVGLMFAPAYVLIEWFLGSSFFGLEAIDTGGSMLVHMVAAYFGIGVAIALRDKRSFDEPMYSTTHSVTFVWLGSLMLWMLWPSFVTGFLPAEETTWGMITCYMAGLGSMISAYFVCLIMEKKVNPLVYAYALLAGPVAIGSPLLLLGPWGALLLGILAGVLTTLCFYYLQPRLSKAMGNLDMMGVHNLHGMSGWLGALVVCVITLSIDNLFYAVMTAVLAVGTGVITGLVVRYTRGEMPIIADDETDFVKNEAPI